MGRHRQVIERLSASAYKVPTERTESDGTLTWSDVGVVVVEAEADGAFGLGYSYTDGAAAARVVEDKLQEAVVGHDPMAVGGAWYDMLGAVRNVGRPGLVACAISAVDQALWDLKARLVGLPLASLLGAMRSEIAVYGSGGFTNLSLDELRDELRGWVEAGIPRVKMKVGSIPGEDPERVGAVRDAIGPTVELFVDANGAYTRKQAAAMAQAFGDFGVTWFEEPVSSDDVAGLAFVRDHAPADMAVTAGEYGYDPFYFRRMIESEAVDVLQADVTRCLGITGFLRVDALCEAFNLPLSAHTAPSAHLAVCAAAATFLHLEYFHDHVRIESELLEGAAQVQGGVLRIDSTRAGNGLALRREEASRYAV